MARARPSSPPDPLDRLVGAAPALQTLRAQIRHLARFDAVGHAAVPTVLLQGETGTGKGLVACLIRDSGPRASGPFIEVNCAAIPETLLEAELFGVEARAFTDAKRAKSGLFEAASGGSLFLDEIAALPLGLQGKSLTAIEATWPERSEAEALATLEGRGVTPITAHGCLGLLYLAQGHLEHAIRVFDQGLALCRASGYRGGWLRLIAAGLGYASALQGRLAEGHALLEEWVREGIRTGAPQSPQQVARAAGGGESASALTEAGQARGSVPVAGFDLRLVH